MRRRYWLTGGLAFLLTMPSCSPRMESIGPAASHAAVEDVGPHGGIIAEIGPRAHAEIICNDGSNLDIYFLAEDIKTPILVDDASIEGFGVVPSQGPLPTRLTLTRLIGDEANHFQTRIPAEWSGKRAAVVFPKVSIAGQRWHFDFEFDSPPDPSPVESPIESPSPATTERELPVDNRAAGTE